MRLCECRIELYVGCFDGQLPAVGHRVARVDRQVHDHLLELVGIGAHAAELRRQHGHERDMLADQPPQHAVHLRDHAIEIEHFGLQHLSAAVREQLSRQRCRSLGGFANLFHVPPFRVPRWKIPEQELRVAEDGGEQVVEIVGDATRELAHGFHLLRLPELLFEMPLFADVALGTPDTNQPSLLDEADDVIKEDAGAPVPRLLARLRVGQAVSGTDE